MVAISSESQERIGSPHSALFMESPPTKLPPTPTSVRQALRLAVIAASVAALVCGVGEVLYGIGLAW